MVEEEEVLEVVNSHRDIKAHFLLIKRGVKCSANIYSRKTVSKNSIPCLLSSYKSIRINHMNLSQSHRYTSVDRRYAIFNE